MSADGLWCSWCRQPHAPCATTPAMEAERAATLRARLQERYERPERPCTYDPADEEPEAEPVAPTPEDRLRPHLRALAHESHRFEAQYPSDDWTPPRPSAVEYSGIPVAVDPEQEEGTARLVHLSSPGMSSWGLLDLPAVAPQGGPDPLVTRYPSDMFAPPRDASARADEIRRHPLTGTSTWDTLTLPPGGDAFEVKPDGTHTVGGSFPCVCGAILRWEGNPNTATNEDGTPHTCPTVEPSITDTTDPAWVRQIHGAPPGQPVRLLAAGSADDYTAEMAEHRATIYRAQGYTDVSVSVYRPEPQPPREECPACGEYGWHASRCDLDSHNLRSYLRTLTNPDATAEDVAAALDLLTDEDFALVDPRNVEGFKLLAALPLMKRVRVAPTKGNP